MVTAPHPFPLTVFKASAGSGKTFTLAVEYIKLLISNPHAFRQTLAVTFTNKATEEMKMRILSQLYGIWKQEPDSRAYLQKVCDELGVSPDQASSQAGTALHLLLHNYSHFRVETIDSFFQSVLRNLARELDLSANLRVGLNDAQVEEMAVDQLIESLQSTDAMLQWLLRYIMDTISDDRSWNVIGQIKQFGKTIFRDYYKQQSSELNRVMSLPDFFDQYTASLRQLRQEARERMLQIADSFFDAIEAEGLSVDDFSYKSHGVCSIFIKLRQGTLSPDIVTTTVANAVGCPDKWVTKSHPRADFIRSLAESELDALLRYAVSEQPVQWRRYQSADLTLRHLSQLRLLGSIESRVRELNETANRFLLSDTQQLLHDLIDGSDSPFIFEKIGSQLEHIMIDEFQDTSTVQWKNFKVLLEEAMSHEDTSNLIVGDVKQSIYRWRSGDWRLLAGIREQFADAAERVLEKPLDTNYRSLPNIIRFNNAFFTEAALQEEVSAYDDVCQKWPAGKPDEGEVSIRLLPATDYEQATLDLIVSQIEQLRQRGVSPARMAILVRSNRHIPLIANHLLEHVPDIGVVSDEAFRLDASPAVQVIVHALRWILQPDDAIAGAVLAKAWTGDIGGPLPEALADHASELGRLPLYELSERLYAIFRLDRMAGQSAYLCAFFDQVATYAGENVADVAAFLAEWDTRIGATTIQSPEVNGLRIISIHKSKGLEFDHVIIPFCDWRLEHNDILWCRPHERPFSQLPIVPVDYSKAGLTGTIYEDAYQEEHQQSVVDNLNLLYVAFTRASRSLFVIGRRGAASSRSVLLEQVLPQLKLKGAALDGMTDAARTLSFDYGSPSAVREQGTARPPSANPFLQKATPVSVDIGIHTAKVSFKQSNRSQLFATPDESATAPQSGYIQLGSVLHQVFSTIRTSADIDAALERMELEGILYDRSITRPHLQEMIRRRLADPRVAEWFSTRWTLYNECTILTPDGQERRPDRVMTDGKRTIVVDFKFGTEREEYHQQVRQYMELLQQMGMPAVSGFLWLVYSNKIIPVK